MTRVRKETRKLHTHEETVRVKPYGEFVNLVGWFLETEALTTAAEYVNQGKTNPVRGTSLDVEAALVTPEPDVPDGLEEAYDWSVTHTGEGAGNDAEDGLLPFDDDTFDVVVGLIDGGDIYDRAKPFHECTRVVAPDSPILYRTPKWVPDSDRVSLQTLGTMPGLATDEAEQYPDVDYLSEWVKNPGQQSLAAWDT